MKRKDIIAFFCMAGYIAAVFTGLRAYAANEYDVADVHMETIMLSTGQIEDKDSYKLLAVLSGSDELCTDICEDSIVSSITVQ